MLFVCLYQRDITVAYYTMVLVEDPVDEKRPPQTPSPPLGTESEILARAHMGLFGEINRFVVHLERPLPAPPPPPPRPPSPHLQ